MKTNLKLTILAIYCFVIILFSSFVVIKIEKYSPELFWLFELKEHRNFKLNNISIGIISNPKLNPKNKYNHFHIENLRYAFNTFQKRNVSVIIVIGNIVNNPSKESYLLFNKIYSSFFPDEKFPIKILSIGENEYNEENDDIEKYKVIFTKYFNQSITETIKIGLFVFIKYAYFKNKNISNIAWLKNQINSYYNSKIPIFLITSITENNYIEIHNVIKDYKNIVLLNGNSNYSLIDDRSFSDENYFEIHIQSVSYIKLNSNYKIENGLIPFDENENNEIAFKNPMGLILNLFNNNITINRYFLKENKIYDNPWIIPNTLLNEKIFFLNYKNNLIPYFPNSNSEIKIYKNKNNKHVIQFLQASFKTLVCQYQIIIENEKIKKYFYYFSDFFLMPEERKKEISLVIKETFSGIYLVKIYAKNCYDIISKNFLSQIIEFK